MGTPPRVSTSPRGGSAVTTSRVGTLLVAAIFLVAACSSAGPKGASAPQVSPRKETAGGGPPGASAGQGRETVRKPKHENVYAHTKRLAAKVRNVPQRVYVPNSLGDSVDVIDPKTYRVIGSFPVGAQPQHITPSWDMKRLYVDNTQGDFLTVIDPRGGKPVGRKRVVDPYNLYFTPNGSKAIVVAERFRRLDFRDPNSWSLLKSVPIPDPGADHLDFSADSRYLLLSTEYSGMVYRVNVRAMKVTGKLRVGGLPIDVRLSPDGSVFYVANQGRNGVSVIDPQKMREIKFIPTGRGAHGLYVSRNTRFLYVSNRLAGTISVISFRSRRVVRTWRVGQSPDMMQLSPNGKELWVSNRFHSTVSVIGTRTGRVLRVIPVGASPHGLTYFPAPGRFCIGHNGLYR